MHLNQRVIHLKQHVIHLKPILDAFETLCFKLWRLRDDACFKFNDLMNLRVDVTASEDWFSAVPGTK